MAARLETLNKPEQKENLLEGKVVIITGASRDIGAEIARVFGKQNPKVIIAPHRQGGKMDVRAQEVAAEVEKFGAKMVAPVCDITDLDARQQLFDYVKKTYGKVDILIHNAGGGFKTTKVGPKDSFLTQDAFNVNAKAKEELTELFLPIMADTGIVLDAASKVSQFFGRDIEEPIEGYTEIASTKKQGGKMVKAVIQAFNAKNNKSIRFGTVCGHAVDGTLIARQIQRKNRENTQNLKQTALNGALPTMADMANGFLKMAVESFEDGHVEFIGIPVWEKEDIAQALPMYDEQSTYLERLVFFDENQGFGYLKVRDEHTKKQFEPDEFSIDRVVFPDGYFEAFLTAKQNHTQGHFTPETGISVLPGHKQIAALIQAYEQGFSGKLRPDEYLKFMGVYNVKFIQPVLPDNTIKISVKDSYAGFWGMFLGNASIFVGKDKVCMMESETFTVEKGEEPKTITPDRLIEAAAQTLGCLYLNQKNPENVIPVFQGFEIAEFEDIEITPGQTVEIEAKLKEQNDNGFTGDVNIWVNDKKAVVIERIQCGLMDKERLKDFFRRLREKRKRQGLKKEEEEK